jgi:hypothetical protein
MPDNIKEPARWGRLFAQEKAPTFVGAFDVKGMN